MFYFLHRLFAVLSFWYIKNCAMHISMRRHNCMTLLHHQKNNLKGFWCQEVILLLLLLPPSRCPLHLCPSEVTLLWPWPLVWPLSVEMLFLVELTLVTLVLVTWVLVTWLLARMSSSCLVVLPEWSEVISSQRDKVYFLWWRLWV